MELPSIPSIATGTFTGGPKDELATADIYKIKSAITGAAKPITSIQELSAAIDKTVFDLTLDAGIASDFMSKAMDGAAQFDKNILTNRLLGISSEFKSSFNELSEAIKKGALANTLADQANSLMCMVNDTKSMVDSANINDVRSLGNFINKYTGTKIFSGQDKGALGGLLSSVITTSSNLGISGAFKAISDTVNDNGILGRVTRAVLPIAIKNSDTRLLKEMTSGPTGQLVNIFAPGFTQNFSRGFSYRGDRGKSLDTFEDIFTSFKNIDQAWDFLQRGDQDNSALNLLSIMGGSQDFQNLMMTGVKYWAKEQAKADGKRPPVPIDPMYALASVYQEITVGQAIARDFPKVALMSVYNGRLPKRNGQPAGTRNRTNNNFLDPRLVQGALGALFGY